jgi:hypothetical protein
MHTTFIGLKLHYGLCMAKLTPISHDVLLGVIHFTLKSCYFISFFQYTYR